MKNSSLIFCLLLFFSTVAFGSDTDLTLTRAMDSAGFTAEQVTQIENAINTAEQQGFPADAVRGKVYEGIAKHIDPDRIVQALERVTSRYEYGYTLARKLTSKENQVIDLGNTMTAGIAAGMTRQDTQKLVDSLQSRSRLVNPDELFSLAEETMLTARDLSRQGVSSTTTTDMVNKAVQRGFAASEMHTMRNAFNNQASQENRESLAKNYGTAIDHGVQAHDLETQGSGSRGPDSMRDSRGSTGSVDSNDGPGSGSSDKGNSSGGSSGSGGSDSSGNGNEGGKSGGGGGSSEGSGGSGGAGGSGGSGGSGNGGHR